VGTFSANYNIDIEFLYGLKTGEGVEGALYSSCFSIEFLNSLEIGTNALINKSVE
jgi:hypothetical protein